MYAKIVNEQTKLCEVGIGTNIEFYKSIGMEEMEVEQAYNGQWYVKGYAPTQPLQEVKAEIQKRLTDGVQNWMDTKVQERNYDNVHTCVGTYLYSPVEKFRIEAEHVKDWVSYVWAKCYEILAQVKNGEREILTLEEVINELPILDWGVE